MNSVRFMISKEENLASGPNKSLITQSFCVAEIYYSEKRTENASDTDTSERGRVPHSLSLSRPYILFQLVTNNRKVFLGRPLRPPARTSNRELTPLPLPHENLRAVETHPPPPPR